MKNKLLTRDEFREAVLNRDGYKCVICGDHVTEVHHIMERALWPDGGYYMNNGASVCAKHHWDCETGLISPGQLRDIIGIPELLPPGLDPRYAWDKWGTPRTYVSCPYCELDTKGAKKWNTLDFAKGEGYAVRCEHCYRDFIVKREGDYLVPYGIPRVKIIGKTKEGKRILGPNMDDPWTAKLIGNEENGD